MKNILAINFKRHGDIFSSSRAFRSLKSKYPHCNITVLCYKEFESSAKCLALAEDVITIDRKNIENIRKNKLFSYGLGINFFMQELSSVTERSWDQVINLSNDAVAVYLCSYLAQTGVEVLGTSYDEHKSLNFSNEWASFYNEVYPEINNTPYNLIQIHQNIISCEAKVGRESLTENSDFQKTVIENFRVIKNKKGQDSLLIGVQVKASHPSKFVSESDTVNLINRLHANSLYSPVILIAPTEVERSYAQDLNAKTSQNTIIIEAEFEAIVSVVKNLDVVITPDTSIKHIADNVGTPVVEVSKGESPIFKQGSINEKSIIVSPLIKKREFNKNCLQDVSIDSILDALNFVTGRLDIKTLESKMNESFFTYFNNRYHNINPKADVDTYLMYHFNERFLDHKLSVQRNDQISKRSYLNSDEVKLWVEKNSNYITSCSKSLLTCLRQLATFKNDNRKIELLIDSIEGLYLFESNNKATALSIRYFQSKIENISRLPILEKIHIIETALFELKNDLSRSKNILRELSISKNSVSTLNL